jgi:protoporphyrinogen oxidase
MPLQGKGAKDDVMFGTKKNFASKGPDPEKTDTVMLIRNRVSRIFYRRRFFDYPMSLKAQTFLNMGFGNSFLAGISFLYSSIKKREENSLENFYINRFGKKLYTMFFENHTEKVWGVHPSKLSAAWGAQRVKDLIMAVNTGGGGKAPEHITKNATEPPYRDFITVGLLLKKLKLRNKTKGKTSQNIIPDCWIYIQEGDVRIGRLQIFNNWSPYMVRDPENTVWIGLEYFCNEGDYLWNLSSEDFINFAIGELVKINIIDREDVLDATQVKIEKAYPAYFGSYSEMDSIRNYLDTIGNLYCLGRNGQHKYNNMDHSMLTAIEAVKLIKLGISDKSAVWNVNTEKEYHEENK